MGLKPINSKLVDSTEVILIGVLSYGHSFHHPKADVLGYHPFVYKFA